MNKTDSSENPGDMRPEYDFSGAVRGKYYRHYLEGVTLPAHASAESDPDMWPLRATPLADPRLLAIVDRVVNADRGFPHAPILADDSYVSIFDSPGLVSPWDAAFNRLANALSDLVTFSLTAGDDYRATVEAIVERLETNGVSDETLRTVTNWIK